MKKTTKKNLKKLLQKWGMQDSVKEIVKVKKVLKTIVPEESLKQIEKSLDNISSYINSTTTLNETELKNFSDQLEKLSKSLEELKAKEPERDTELENKLLGEINGLRTETFNRLSNIGGGGNMNRQIKVGGVDVLKKYTDINWKAGTNISLSTAVNEINRNVEITINSTALSTVAWGSITGTLSNQTDLQTALDAKQPTGNYITALTGDATASGPGSVALTLATVNGNVGTFGSATKSITATVNGKGLITAMSEATITPAVGSITGLGTGVATALGINVGSAGAFVTFNGALGTPSSGTLTNATGLPISTGVSGLGTGVATFLATPSSANLAAAVTDETGSGKLVFDTSPQFTSGIGIGIAAVANTMVIASQSLNGVLIGSKTTNTNNGSAAYVSQQMINDTGSVFAFFLNSSNNTTYAGTNTITFDMASNFDMGFATNDALRLRISNVGNIKIGTAAQTTAQRGTTEGAGSLTLFNGTDPAGTLTNGASFFCTSGEMKVIDAAGNITLLSPHDKQGNWIYDSRDSVTGRHLRIDMEKMLRFLNNKFGTDFIKEFYD